MTNTAWQANVARLKELNNLFIEMTAKSCNQRCKHCYIDFPMYKKVEDFISIDIIKNALNDTTKDNIKCIYLTGAEPMTHPDFNAILRLCLKRCSVCICTNGSFINEKKARFLKKVEGESDNEIIFKISIDHYTEVKNDDIRARGSFRQAVFAVKHLVKYGFEPIIVCANYYKESEENLYNQFCEVFSKVNYSLDNSHLQVIPWYDRNNKEEFDENFKNNYKKLDCETSRVITSKGVYSCPFLSDDYRGRCGSSFRDYSDKCSLETDFCQTCLKYGNRIFSIDFEGFDK